MTNHNVQPFKPAASNAAKSLVERAMEPLAPAEADAKEIDAAWRPIVQADRYPRGSLSPRSAALTALDIDDISERVARLRAAAFGETNHATARVLFGMMLDAIPAARNIDGASYLDALVSTLSAEPREEWDEYENARVDRGGFTNTVIAAGVRDLWRNHTFAPSIAEVLTSLHCERRRLQGALRRGEWLLREWSQIDREYVTIYAGGDDDS